MSIAKDLKAAAKNCYGPDLTRIKYFEQQNPCVFLDVKKGECTIYEDRPSSCRYLYVVSPAENCSVDFNGEEILTLNMEMLKTTVSSFSAMVSGGLSVTAPLPIMVLFCMQACAPNKKAEQYLKRLCVGLPDPIEWMTELVANKKFRNEDTPEVTAAVMESFGLHGIFTDE